MKPEPVCQHKTGTFLTSHVTPHMYEPDTKSVMCCIFACVHCGELYTSAIEVLRGYMPDGTLPPEIAKISAQKVQSRQMDMLVEARAGKLMSQRLQEMDQEAKRAGAVANPNSPAHLFPATPG